ncbi:hypothetical protein BREVUG8_100052 [Brevundimonas sp. G8]|nr:hypothetical protein BREVUG8_100052 [Brevundimonas sp. G8]
MANPHLSSSFGKPRLRGADGCIKGVINPYSRTCDGEETRGPVETRGLLLVATPVLIVRDECAAGAFSDCPADAVRLSSNRI